MSPITATRITFTGTVAALILTSGGAATASPPREPDTSAPSSTSPYAEPLQALGGRTQAQYLAEHHAEDPRLG